MVTIAGAKDSQWSPVRRQGGDQQVRHDGREWRRTAGGGDADQEVDGDEVEEVDRDLRWLLWRCQVLIKMDDIDKD